MKVALVLSLLLLPLLGTSHVDQSCPEVKKLTQDQFIAKTIIDEWRNLVHVPQEVEVIT